MGEGERFVEEAVKLAVRGVREGRRLARRRKRAQRRLLRRSLLTVLALVASTALIVPSMIAGGLFLGPTGAEGFLLTPFVLLLAWSLIVYLGWMRKPRPVALLPQGTAIAALPERTDAWLEFERSGLPWVAQNTLDGISSRLEGLTPRLRETPEDRPAAVELRRLLGDELPKLVNGYRRVPAALAQKPLYGGATPEQQLIDGLATIERELARLEGQLAEDDMHDLATHQRYLDLKYNRKDGME